MSETRKIAAILVADVVGYSKLAGADEERTLARLRGLRSDLIDPAIAAHRGRIVKRTGDGSLIEFRSVVDAVRCAIEVQTGMVERNAGLPPEKRIEFRVGVHLGDVVEEADGDLMGDGVNIAARLQGICEPGAICLSEDAYRQVKGRLDLAVSDLGHKELKNIAEPIRVYSLEVGRPAQAKPAATVAAAKAGSAASGPQARAWLTRWPALAASLVLGAPGIIRAMEECFPRSARQRCLAHRMRNLAAKVSADPWPEFKARVTACYQAPSRAIARQLAAGIRVDYANALPSALACFEDDFEALRTCACRSRIAALHGQQTSSNGCSSRNGEGSRPPISSFSQQQLPCISRASLTSRRLLKLLARCGPWRETSRTFSSPWEFLVWGSLAFRFSPARPRTR